MKLEVGQFVRTPYGIRKIVNITKDDGYGKPRVKVIELDDFLNTGYKFNYKFYTDEKIIKECKASYNIIDILEIGDYVNGDEIGYIDDCEGAMREFYYDYENPNEDVGHWQEEIKTVITHEQMEQMAYKVGE